MLDPLKLTLADFVAVDGNNPKRFMGYTNNRLNPSFVVRHS